MFVIFIQFVAKDFDLHDYLQQRQSQLQLIWTVTCVNIFFNLMNGHLLQGLAAPASINSGTLSLLAGVQFFNPPPLSVELFLLFVIENRDLFFSRLCLRKDELMKYVGICLKGNLMTLHSCVTYVFFFLCFIFLFSKKGSRKKRNNPIYETFFSLREWENFYLGKIQHIKY